MRKYLAEFIGTMVLVLFGCGTAVFTGGFSGGLGQGYLGVLAIAMAFGLAIVAMAYSIGSVSGCHINPAVSLGMLLLGKISVVDFFAYLLAQFLGGIAGAGLLQFLVSSTNLPAGAGLGQNGYGAQSALGLSLAGAIVVEVVLTFVFVSVVIWATSSKGTPSMAGVIIGLALAFVHILGIPLTGTSVNPARSLGPALFAGGAALQQVWVFLVAPLAGAALAAVLYRFVFARRAARQESTEEILGFITFK